MHEPKHPSQVKVFTPVIVLLVIGLIVVYAVNAMNTNDPLWFKSTEIKARPARIIVRQNGKDTLHQPGTAHFNALADAANTTLQNINNTSLIPLGLSEETLAYMEHNGTQLLLYYDNPINFHTSFRAGTPTQVMIPIDGRHAGDNHFFRGAQGEWWFGALRVDTMTDLYAVLEDMGYVASNSATNSN